MGSIGPCSVSLALAGKAVWWFRPAWVTINRANLVMKVNKLWTGELVSAYMDCACFC